MPTSATWVEHREFFERPGPALKRAGRRGGRPSSGGTPSRRGPCLPARLPCPEARRCPACAPPGPDRVVQEELDHVVLGEQLRYRGQCPPVDLRTALVDFFFPLGLPELVDPAQTVIRQKRLAGQS